MEPRTALTANHYSPASAPIEAQTTLSLELSGAQQLRAFSSVVLACIESSVDQEHCLDASPTRRALMMLASVEGADRTATLGWKTTCSRSESGDLYSYSQQYKDA